ncbi:hypothetical protein BD779DRAFT_1473715 [Infundibulicybe gibba]|nr:hypothetical protein BD779DRAFT_1473715 [Infundibulicybe gibba]
MTIRIDGQLAATRLKRKTPVWRQHRMPECSITPPAPVAGFQNPEQVIVVLGPSGAIIGYRFGTWASGATRTRANTEVHFTGGLNASAKPKAQIDAVGWQIVLGLGAAARGGAYGHTCCFMLPLERATRGPAGSHKVDSGADTLEPSNSDLVDNIIGGLGGGQERRGNRAGSLRFDRATKHPVNHSKRRGRTISGLGNPPPDPRREEYKTVTIDHKNSGTRGRGEQDQRLDANMLKRRIYHLKGRVESIVVQNTKPFEQWTEWVGNGGWRWINWEQNTKFLEPPHFNHHYPTADQG